MAKRDATDYEPLREKDMLLIYHGMVLPKRCAICNSESDGDPVSKVFRHKRGQGLLGALVSELGKDANYTGPVLAHFHLCSRCRSSNRNIAIVILIAALIGGVGTLSFRAKPIDADGIFLSIQISFLVALVLTVFLLLIGKLKFWSLKAKAFDDRNAWIAGCGDAFLRTFKEVEYEDEDNGARL